MRHSILLALCLTCLPAAAAPPAERAAIQPLLRIGGPDDPDRPDSLRAVALSPDGFLAALAGEVESPTGDEAVQLRDAVTGRLLHTLRGHAKPLRTVAFSPDEAGVVTISSNADGLCVVRLFEVTTGTLRWTTETIGGRAVAFPQPGQVAVADGGRLHRILLHDGHKYREDSAPAVVKDLSADAAWLLGVSQVGRSVLEVRRPAFARATATLAGCHAEPSVAAISPDGRTAAAADLKNNTLFIWEVLTSGLVARADAGAAVLSLTFTPDGRHVAAGLADGTVRVWETATGESTAKIPAHAGAVMALAVSADGRRLLSGGTDRTAAVWDAGPLCGSALPPGPPSPRDLDAGWVALTVTDPGPAYRILGMAAGSADVRADLIGRATGRVMPVPDAELAGLLADLHAPDYQVREQATAQLATAGESIRDHLGTALAATRSPETRGRLRILLRRMRTAPRFGPAEVLRLRRLIPLAANTGEEGVSLLRMLEANFPDATVQGEAKLARDRLEQAAAEEGINGPS